MKHNVLHILLLMILSCLLIAGLCACGQDEAEPESSGSNDGPVSVELQEGQDQSLDLKSSGEVTWKTKDKKVATVSDDGRIVAGEPGETDVTVESDGKTYTYHVKVEDKNSKKSDESKDKKSDSTEKDKKKKKDASDESKDENKDSSNDSDSNKKNKKKKKSEETQAVPENTNPLIQVGAVSAKPGDKDVTVKVMVRNNPGILGMILTLRYDSKALTLKSASNGKAFKDVLKLTKPGELTDGCRFLWDGLELTEDQIKDGDILTLTFDVSKKAKAGDHVVLVSYDEGDIIDGNLETLKMGVIDGKVTVN